MQPQDEYVPLYPLLADYWDKPLSKLPKALRARVGTKVVKRLVGHQPKFDANGEFEHDAEGRYPAWEEVYSEHEVGDFPLGWDTLTPAERQEWVRRIDYKKDPALAGERHVGWYDHAMDARRWWDMQNVTPKEAAMVLCRLNPFEREDPERIYVDGDEASPHRYRLLLRAFEDAASTIPKHRTLMEWRTIAQQRNLPYHSWIDNYADAMGAPAGKQAAPVVTMYANNNDSDVLSKEDSLATEIDAILRGTPTLKPSKVKPKLLDRVGKQNSLIVGSTSGGLQWENNKGDTIETTWDNIEKRIARWKKLWKERQKSPA